MGKVRAFSCFALIGSWSCSCLLMIVTGNGSTTRWPIKSWITDLVLQPWCLLETLVCAVIPFGILVLLAAKQPSGTCLSFPGGSVAAGLRASFSVQLNVSFRWWKAKVPELGLLERSQSTSASMYYSDWGPSWNLSLKWQGSLYHSLTLLHCTLSIGSILIKGPEQ